MLVFPAHVPQADITDPGDPDPRGPGCGPSLPHVEPVAWRPAGAGPGRGRVSVDAAPPIRGGRHRHPNGPAPGRAARRRGARQEPLAGPLGGVGRRVVSVDRRARLLVRPARTVECRLLPPATAPDQRDGVPHWQRRRRRTPRCQLGSAGCDPGSLALGASGSRSRRSGAGRAVAPRLSFLVLLPRDLCRVTFLPARDAGARRERARAATGCGILGCPGRDHASHGHPAHACAGLGALAGLAGGPPSPSTRPDRRAVASGGSGRLCGLPLGHGRRSSRVLDGPRRRLARRVPVDRGEVLDARRTGS